MTRYREDHVFSPRADMAYGHMLWYSWGRMDAKGSTEGTNLDHGFKVARLYRNDVEDFVLDKRGWLDSVMGFYTKNTEVAAKDTEVVT